jgi:hypothetical protein
MTASKLWDNFAKRVVILASLPVLAINGWWAHRVISRNKEVPVPSALMAGSAQLSYLHDTRGAVPFRCILARAVPAVGVQVYVGVASDSRSSNSFVRASSIFVRPRRGTAALCAVSSPTRPPCRAGRPSAAARSRDRTPAGTVSASRQGRQLAFVAPSLR